MKPRFLFAFTASAILSSPAAAGLSRPEQVMVQTVDAEQQRTLAMLQRWVDQNSGTMNKAGVVAVRDMIEPEFKALGFMTQWIDMGAVSRAGHLVARHVGSRRGKRLLLIGHLDTCSNPILLSSAGSAKATSLAVLAPATTRGATP
jgi:glutamate carboxypeptidase